MDDFVLDLIDPQCESEDTEDVEEPPARSRHFFIVVTLKGDLEEEDCDRGENGVRNEIVLHYVPLCVIPVLVKEAFDEFGRVDLTGEALKNRAERCEVLPVGVQPAEVVNADVDGS